MKRKGFLAVLFLVIILAPSLPGFAWEEEILNGHYSYESKKLSLSFDWRASGIKNLRINSRRYDDNQVTLDRFGDIECYQIRVHEGAKESKVIRIVFLLRKENVVFVSGYFAELNNLSENGDFQVSLVTSIILKHSRFKQKEVE